MDNSDFESDFEDYYGDALNDEEEEQNYTMGRTSYYSGQDIVNTVIGTLIQDGNKHEVSLHVGGELIDMEDLSIIIRTTTVLQ